MCHHNASDLNAPFLPVECLPKQESQDDMPENKPKPKQEEENPPEEKDPEKPQEIELKSAGIVFIIDRSGSMADQKLDIARKSILASIARLWEKDIFGIIAFDHEATWIIPIGRGTDINWISERILQIGPRGSTKIAPAIEKAYTALTNVSTHIKHIILLSDGQDDSGIWAKQELAPLVQKLQENKITITTIGIGGEFDADLMGMIARIGKGNFHIASGYHQIPILMLKDIDRVLKVRKDQEGKKYQEKPLVIKEKPLFQTPKEMPQKQKRQTPVQCVSQNPWFKKFEPFPSLVQRQLYRSKKEAKQELLAEKYPLLIHWQWSLGKVVVWGSDSQEWSDWPQYTLWWSGLVRFFSQESLGFPFFLTALPEVSNHIPYALSITDSKGNPIENLTIKSNFSFSQQTPIKWTALVPLKPEHEWQKLSLEIQQEGKKIANCLHAFASGYSKEQGELKVNKKLLKELAEKSRGGFLPQNEETLLSLPQEQTKLFFTEYILWIALCASFVLTVYWRKIA